MESSVISTNFTFPLPFEKKSGKVRDLYLIGSELIALVATDRISAFDVVLPDAIPFKGQVLTQLAVHFLEATKDIVPNYMLSHPDPNVIIGLQCNPFPIEMVVRAYLAGHAWRLYKAGSREICGVALPDGLKENDKLEEPIITPTTKSLIGHDEDISEREILKSGLLDPEEYYQIRHYALALFKKGSEMARERGLILVDTKYEFGLHDDKVYLIDEIHTPDSSRYFYADTYKSNQSKGLPQRQLSKEFVRQWLLEKGFSGQEGQEAPLMSEEFISEVSGRYIHLYELLTEKPFIKGDTTAIQARIQANIEAALQNFTS